MSMAHVAAAQRWRGALATWSAAAWMVMQQFGVFTESSAAAESRVVWSEDITRLLAEQETLADGRVVTIPIEGLVDAGGRNRDLHPAHGKSIMSLN